MNIEWNLIFGVAKLACDEWMKLKKYDIKYVCSNEVIIANAKL